MESHVRKSVNGSAFAFLCVLIFLSVASAGAQITCGHSDGPGKKLKHTIQDPNDPTKSVKYFCVDGAYFSIEVMCGEVNTRFAKCVFDGGKNQPIPFPGPNGWPKWVWYNWDPTTCNVPYSETRRRAGESAEDHARRVRRLLIDRGCDFNCYTWTRGGDGGGNELVAGRTGEPNGLFIEVFRGGDLIDAIDVPPEEIDFFFDGGFEFLIEDPAMHLETSPGQDANLATGFVERFDDGIIADRYSPLPGTEPLSIEDESLHLTIAQTGDGLNIDTAGLQNPSCLTLDGLDIEPFNAGDGLGFLIDFDSGDNFELQLFQTNSVRVKAVEKKSDGTQTEIIRTVPGLNLDDISHLQIDWVPSPGTRLERIEIEIWTKDGRKIVKKFRSGLTHKSGRTSAYRITGLDIDRDPWVLIDTIDFSEEHTDFVEGFTGDLTVDDLLFSDVPTGLAAGDTGSIVLSPVNAFGIPLPVRELVLTASSDAIAFTNAFGLISEDGREVTLTSDENGVVTANFIARDSGNVRINVSAEGGEAALDLDLEIDAGAQGSCIATPTNLCLNGGRFRVEANWRDFAGNTGVASSVSIPSDDSGLLWFFTPDNLEMLVKVLDGCAINGHFWVFAAATTNVEYALTVTDTETGAVQQYFNPLGVSSCATTDTSAFATCP